MTIIIGARNLLAGVALTASGTSAIAQLADCIPVLSVPTVISAPGVYCLTDNLSAGTSDTSAIEIAANDVVLDLGGFKLNGSATSANAKGVHALNRRSLTIRNGTIEGFHYGIHLEHVLRSRGVVDGHVIERMRLRNQVQAIAVNGDGVTIRSNQIIRRGGSKNVEVSVTVMGTGGRIIDNDMHSRVHLNALAILIDSSGAVVARNRVNDFTRGLFSYDFDTHIVDNRFIYSGSGSSLPVEGMNAAGFCRDNMVAGFGSTQLNCSTDAGGNFVAQ